MSDNSSGGIGLDCLLEIEKSYDIFQKFCHVKKKVLTFFQHFLLLDGFKVDLLEIELAKEC